MAGPRLRLTTSGPEGYDAAAYVLEKTGLPGAAEALGPEAAAAARLGGFRGEAGESLILYRAGEPGRLILAGAGERGKEWYGEAERLRVAVAAAVAAARGLRGVKRLWVGVPAGLLEAAAGEHGLGEAWAAEQALVAADMASYIYTRKTREPPREPEEIALNIGGEPPAGAEERAAAIAAGVRRARDLANAPPSWMNPARVEEEARRLAKELGLGIRVLHVPELESLGMGGILAVGRGGAHEPRLIILEYRGGGPHIAVVGKTVTFDSGGLDLKPPQYMLEMKYDKAGGAAAIGAIEAAARLRLPVDMTVLIPAVENMPDARSYKPLDVITMYNGLTVEVGNTDAEGRIIMADALAYAAEKLRPSLLLDLATLTGAAVIALGNHAAALIANREETAKLVEQAAWRAGEPAWRLPSWPIYEKQLESKTADTSNVGGRAAGAITAAKFLEKFVGDTPWAHLDIAGVAWVEEKGPWRPYYSQGGATGWGVRTVIETARQLAGAKP